MRIIDGSRLTTITDTHTQGGYVKVEYQFAGRGTHNEICYKDRQHLAHSLSSVL
jgi:hypothetical protein